jgi:hypothetical protein
LRWLERKSDLNSNLREIDYISPLSRGGFDMHIDETNFPIQDDWSGELVPPQGVFRAKGSALPRVSLGKPDWWSDEAILGEKWQPPDGGQRYGLARFKFSLRPESPQTIEQAEFTVRLLPQGGGRNPLAFDLFPREVTAERSRSLKVGVGPNLTFAEFEGSLGNVETTLDTSYVVPVITVDGLGEHTIRWTFLSQREHPLSGSRVVYAIVELPPQVPAVRASLHLAARVKTGGLGGLVTAFLPDDVAEEQRSWILGES